MAERMRGFDRDGRDRYRDIRPYLDNVVLGFQDVYVNASVIHSPVRSNAFIISQAPMAKTIPEWLGMLSRHNVAFVFCLTVCDSKQRQCHRYWPEAAGLTERFEGGAGGACSVTLQAQTEEASGLLVRRDLRVAQENGHSRAAFDLRHVQFTHWPDHGVPELAALLPVVAALEEARRLSEGRPVAVHCSAGVGRAGTLVAIANCLEKARLNGRVSVLDECVKLRLQRPFLVQTTAQYELIYETLRHLLRSS
jgi:protein tyrosine phosphatase